MKNKIAKLILLLGDITALYLSLYLALIIRYQKIPGNKEWETHFWPFSLIFVIWIIIFYIANLYNLNNAFNNSKFLQKSIRSIIINGLLSIIFFYLTPQIGISPKTNLAIFIFVFAFIFIGWRYLFSLFLCSYPKNNIIIINLNDQAKELIQELIKKPHLGYKPIAIIDNKETKQDFAGIPIIKNINNLSYIIKNKKINTIILGSDPHYSEKLRSILFSFLPLKLNYISLPNFYESITGKIPIEAINQMWFLENLNEGDKFWFDLIKRIYDLILAFLILIVTAPFWPIIGLIIKLESSGPIFFRQKRVGKNGEIFSIVKFRTMITHNNDFSPTLKNDSRITKFGSFLRKTRIDEIPQVLNIILGSMSFVGPRPERPEITYKLEKKIPFYRERTLVKPGLTGWDQISGEYHSPSLEDSIKKLQYDLFYIKNRSIYLDLSIILKTIATVLSKSGV